MLKPQYERGVYRCGWKFGLIEVDLMPTHDVEYSTLRGVDSRLTNYVVGKSIIPGLGLKRKGGICELKRNLGFSYFMEKLKKNWKG